MSINNLPVPLYFTSNEGGKWLKYEGSEFNEEVLEEAVTGAFNYRTEINDSILLKARNKDTNYFVHSLAFEDPFTGKDFARWDVVNGWTEKLSEPE